MPNRSQTNAGHRAMNSLKKAGREHSSLRGLRGGMPAETCHAALVGDCLEVAARLPSQAVQLILCDPPYNIRVAPWDAFENYRSWTALWLRRVPVKPFE